MRILHEAFDVVKNDIRTLSDNLAHTLLNTPLSDCEMHVTKGKYNAASFIYNLVDAMAEWLKSNPDADSVPSSFISPIDTKESDKDPVVHTVSIDPAPGIN